MSTRNEVDFQLRFILDRLEKNGDVWPGAAEKMFTVLRPHCKLATQAAAMAVDFLRAPGGRKYLCDPSEEFSGGAATLKKLIALSPCMTAKREALYDALALRAGPLDAAKQAELISDFLAERENRAFCLSPPELPRGEQRARDLLRRFAPGVRSDFDLDTMAEQLSVEVNVRDDAAAASLIAARLNNVRASIDPRMTLSVASEIATEQRRASIAPNADSDRLREVYGTSF